MAKPIEPEPVADGPSKRQAIKKVTPKNEAEANANTKAEAKAKAKANAGVAADAQEKAEGMRLIQEVGEPEWVH